MLSIVTIDGPSASGKSSVAQRVAIHLGWPFVSSGLLYRGATWLVQQHHTKPEQSEAILALLASYPLQLLPSTSGNQLLAGNHNISQHLHTQSIDRLVSSVSGHPKVRAYVYERLREIPPPFVIEGRDMGSTVFPEAQHKFYLTASPEVRAARRVPERGAAYEQVLADLVRRDLLDQKQSPPAPDAFILDTSHLSLEQVVQALLQRITKAT